MIADHGVNPDDLEAVTGGRVMASDAAAEKLLDQAAASVVAFLGWCPWPSRTETVTLDTNGTNVLSLPSAMVTDVASVAVDGVPVGSGAYRWSQSGLIERVGGVWPRGYRRVVVAFTHGRDPHQLPDVQGVILSLAARRAATPMGQTSVRAGGVAETYGGAGDVMADERAALSKYTIGNGGFGV